ncbi:hypothetical protein PIB30_084064 [Stylosanthes scabra]|uniref:Uncharacterized protein n=1 Tax=Stylosanthes scabra TaxID=79078 RepID=A0ABU6YR94_9FABA|nr:hypothetical protein [Stylosanthes scabra]
MSPAPRLQLRKILREPIDNGGIGYLHQLAFGFLIRQQDSITGHPSQACRPSYSSQPIPSSSTTHHHLNSSITLAASDVALLLTAGAPPGCGPGSAPEATSFSTTYLTINLWY